MFNIYLKKCLTTLIIREIEIKTVMMYHLTLIGCLLSKRQKIENIGGNVERKECI